MTHAVEIAGIDKRHACFNRRMDSGDALGFVHGSVDAGRHAHAAETEHSDRWSCQAKCCSPHVSAFPGVLWRGRLSYTNMVERRLNVASGVQLPVAEGVEPNGKLFVLGCLRLTAAQ